MNIEDPRKNLSVTDLGLASTLRALGFSLVCLQQIGTGRIAFIFSHSAELQDLVQRFWAGQLEVDALSLCNAMKSLKSQIHAPKA